NLNLYDFKARFYDPIIGRFISIDVLAGHPNQIGMSPYQFGWNNPIRYNDPDGECPSCWQTAKALYAGVTAKYSGIVSQAHASSQRLISGTSGSVPAGMGMSSNTQAAMQVAGTVSDVNTVMETGATLGKEVAMDVGMALDKGGEVISDVGVALAVPTKGTSLVLAPIGEGISFAGKSMKAGVHLSNGNVSGAKREAVNFAVGFVTNSAVSVALKQSSKVGLIQNASQQVVQETVLMGTGSAVNKAAGMISNEMDDEKNR